MPMRTEGGAGVEVTDYRLPAFVRASLWSAWLQYRNLRLYPASLLLAGFEQAAPLAVWYFVGRFFAGAAHSSVLNFGGSYVAYLMVGIALSQVGMAALAAPFESLSEAFWDKRLEAYRGTRHGIGASILGRVLFTSGIAAFVDGIVLVILVATGLVHLSLSPNIPGLVLALLLLVVACAGIGAAGASLFFLLEVKSGQDPISWSYRYLVMILSGLYVPVSVLPGWLRSIGLVLPQTWALSAARAATLSTGPLEPGLLRGDLLTLALLSILCVLVGLPLLRLGLRHAEHGRGVGSVV